MFGTRTGVEIPPYTHTRAPRCDIHSTFKIELALGRRHHQHRGKLRHRVLRPKLLAVRHRRQPSQRAQRLPARRHRVVHHPFRSRHCSRCVITRSGLLCDSVQRHAYYEHIPSPSLHALDWMCARAGLAAQALDLGITPDEAGAGLVPPAVAIAYMGNFGGILILTMLFMARTSPACSSSLAVGLAPNTPVGSLKHWVQDHAMRMAWACDR